MKVDYSGYRYIVFAQSGRTMTVTFNRPESLNAMTAEMHEETSRLFYDLGEPKAGRSAATQAA